MIHFQKMATKMFLSVIRPLSYIIATAVYTLDNILEGVFGRLKCQGLCTMLHMPTQAADTVPC